MTTGSGTGSEASVCVRVQMCVCVCICVCVCVCLPVNEAVGDLEDQGMLRLLVVVEGMLLDGAAAAKVHAVQARPDAVSAAAGRWLCRGTDAGSGDGERAKEAGEVGQGNGGRGIREDEGEK